MSSSRKSCPRIQTKQVFIVLGQVPSTRQVQLIRFDYFRFLPNTQNSMLC